MQVHSSKGRRSYNEEAAAKLESLHTLKTILKDTNVVVNKSAGDGHGFMYLSRFSKENSSIASKVSKERAPQSVNDSTSRVGTAELGENKVGQDSGVLSAANNEKKRRYALSLATLASKPEKRQTIVNEGAINVLIELSAIHDSAIQVRCASAFACLSLDRQLRSKILDDGALPAIAALATTSNIREVKTDCARALCNLCCENGYEFKMVKEGIPFVVSHIVSSCPDSYDVCLKLLMNITCVTDKFGRIEDITEALMYFLNINAFLTYEQELLIVTAFRNLAAVKSNTLRLVEDGCLKVVDRFYQSQYPPLRQIACEILKNLTMDHRARMKLLDLNILSILLQMYHDKDEEVRMLCVKSFLYMADDENFRNRIISAGALRQILNFTLHKQQSIAMGQVTAKTLRRLCADRSLSAPLVQDGVGKAIVKLIQTGDHLTRQYCMESLCGLFQTQEILDMLVESGAASEVLNLALNTNEAHLSEWCAFGLYQLSMGCSADSTQESFLKCIIHLCELEAATDITRLFCSAAFAHATLFKSIESSAAIPLLVSMLKRHDTSQAIKKHCATALFNLADSTENCHMMLDSQALLPVVQLTQIKFTEAANDPKVICAGIISRLSLHRQYYDQFAAGDVLKVLLELSSVDHRLTQRRVVIALSNLSQDADLRSKLLALNPIPYIISLASERDEYLRRGCISIVCNMSYLPGSEKAIVSAGIMPTLMITSLITSDQIASKRISVKALVNLMADASLYKSMVKDGVIWGLSKLAQLDDHEILLLCAKALCCFSRDFSRDILNSAVSVRTLMRLIKVPILEIMRAGARALTNILLQTNLSDEEFHKHVVENMSLMGKSEDKELKELSVICLCLASQSESCRTGIVSSGMLQNIDISTIFADTTVSYAYITMFGNIANDPVMRSRVLDEHLIERFDRICMTKEYNLALAVAKALYCLSCSAENIPKLVDQYIVPFVQSMNEYEFESQSDELPRHLVACLYNLSTHTGVQNKLVSQGFVSTMKSLWDVAVNDPTLMNLGYMSMCHLACGKTNTTRMVADGCTDILCFISEYKKNPKYSRVQFGAETRYRCSGALRNLLVIVSNQPEMVSHGVLDTIIDLANFARPDTMQMVNPGSPTYGNMRGIRRNCAVALNSMTYNKDVRDKLVQSEAINIILADVEKDSIDMHIGHGLLRELEAESWDNGARGRQKDGRSKYISPGPLFTDFLVGAINVNLDVALKSEELEKYYVQVQLDEEPTTDADSEAPDSPMPFRTPAGTPKPRRSLLSRSVSEQGFNFSPPPTAKKKMPDGMMVDAVDDRSLSILSLTPYNDGDDTLQASSIQFQKEECEAGIETLTLFRIENLDEMGSQASDDATENNSLHGQLHAQVSKNSLAASEPALDDHQKAIDAGTRAAVMNSMSIDETTKKENALAPESSKVINSSQLLPSLFLAASRVAAPLPSAPATPPPLNKSKSIEELPKLSVTQRDQKARFKESVKAQQRAREDAAMSGIIDMIKDARSKGGSLDTVLDKWRSISQF